MLAPATVNREIALLRVFLNHLINQGLLPSNPVSKVRMLKEEPAPIRVLSDDEERLYLFAATQPLKDVAAIMIDTGMRPTEVFTMKWENVFLEDGYIFVPNGKTRNARRNVPMTDRVAGILASRLNGSKDELVFMNPDTRRPYISLKTAHATALRRSEVKRFRVYDLRHTFATRVAESGGDLMTLKDLLGHSNIQMVTRYAHPTDKHKFEAIKRMEARRGSNGAKMRAIGG